MKTRRKKDILSPEFGSQKWSASDWNPLLMDSAGRYIVLFLRLPPLLLPCVWTRTRTTRETTTTEQNVNPSTVYTVHIGASYSSEKKKVNYLSIRFI